jgi:hypothetical protein
VLNYYKRPEPEPEPDTDYGDEASIPSINPNEDREPYAYQEAREGSVSEHFLVLAEICAERGFNTLQNATAERAIATLENASQALSLASRLENGPLEDLYLPFLRQGIKKAEYWQEALDIAERACQKGWENLGREAAEQATFLFFQSPPTFSAKSWFRKDVWSPAAQELTPVHARLQMVSSSIDKVGFDLYERLERQGYEDLAKSVYSKIYPIHEENIQTVLHIIELLDALIKDVPEAEKKHALPSEAATLIEALTERETAYIVATQLHKHGYKALGNGADGRFVALYEAEGADYEAEWDESMKFMLSWKSPRKSFDFFSKSLTGRKCL